MKKYISCLWYTPIFGIMVLFWGFVKGVNKERNIMRKVKFLVLAGWWVIQITANSVSADLINVALQSNGAVASADSWGNWANLGSGPPNKAIDGSYSPFMFNGSSDAWCGQNIPGWLMVEFDSIYKIEVINIWWEPFDFYTYSIELSTDTTNWTTVFQELDLPNINLPPVYTGAKPWRISYTINPTYAKYVRLNINDSVSSGSIVLISELQAYAVPEPATLLLLSLGTLVLLRKQTVRLNNKIII